MTIHYNDLEVFHNTIKSTTGSFPERKRIKELDYLRGFAMILVILGHCNCPMGDYISAFHMPLFFFISGLTLSLNNSRRPFKEFLSSRFFRLLIPYFLFEIISLVISFSLCIIHGDDINLWGAINDIILVRHSIGTFAHTGFIARFWFFPCLFFSSLIVILIIQHSNWKLLPAWLGLLLLCGFFVYRYLPVRIPFSVDIAIVATSFVLLGYLFSKQTFILLKNVSSFDILYLLGGGGLLLISVEVNPGTVKMFINEYGNFFLMLLGSFSGIVMSVVLTKYLLKLTNLFSRCYISRLIMHIGVISLPLFPAHMYIIYFLEHIHSFHWSWLFLLTMAISIPVAGVIAKRFPLLSGNAYTPLHKKSYRS